MDTATQQTDSASLLPMLEIEYWPIGRPIPYDRNPRKITDEAVAKVAQSIRQFGFTAPIIVDESDVILAGHTRLRAGHKLGMDTVPIVQRHNLTEAQKRAYRIADNRVAEESKWDTERLQQEIAAIEALDFDVSGLGFDASELDAIMKFSPDEDEAAGALSGGTKGGPQKGSLADRFGVPPFTVLSARDGWWQDRKRAWLELGIKSELGRGDNLGQLDGAIERHEGKHKANVHPARTGRGGLNEQIAPSKNGAAGLTFGRRKFEMQRGGDSGLTGTSVFDPVLCELIYRWFCPPGGIIIDPFAGGSVRGIVASHLMRRYFGVDLRREQIGANLEQLEIAGPDHLPSWYCGDSRELGQVLPAGVMADLIFTCPPYADLEVYSDDPRDLSTMGFADFSAAYLTVLEQAVQRLSDDRFAVIVIGDARDEDGNYYGLPWLTVQHMQTCGLKLYNEAVLVTMVGSVPSRCGKAFEASRKLGKTHQNVLVFVKGDARAATEAIGPCDFALPPDEESEQTPDGVPKGDPNAGFKVADA
jgi:DNA modification methylase